MARKKKENPEQLSLPIEVDETQQSELSAETQSDLPVRVDGATIQQRLTQEIKQRNPRPDTYRQVNAKVHQEMLDESVQITYEREGVKSGDRSRLPHETQVKLIAGDIGATQEIIQTDAQGHEQIVDAARSGARAMRRRFF